MHAYFHTVALAPWWFKALVGFGFGAIFASFFGVVGERVPRHETLGGRSHCVCGADLGATNLPIVGWIMIRGRARCCAAKVPVRYVLTELFLALAWASALAFSISWVLRIAIVIISSVLALVVSWQSTNVIHDNESDAP
jgi:leader peptidase (prepilin peptidase)/N-methyltransferase